MKTQTQAKSICQKCKHGRPMGKAAWCDVGAYPSPRKRKCKHFEAKR